MTTIRLLDWDRRTARRGALDGVLLLGTADPYVYHLPSCVLAKGRKADLTAFASEAQARAAGLKPCKLCKPHRLHAERGDGLDLFQALSERLEAEPASVSSPAALAEAVGVTDDALAVVLGDHAHATAGEWLERKRVAFAARQLLELGTTSRDAGHAAGFPGTKPFERTFGLLMGMTPDDYRQLGTRPGFSIRLPADYRKDAVLAYQGRDVEGLAERSDASRVWKALDTPDGPAIVDIRFEGRLANVNVTSPRRLGIASVAILHRDVLKVLGLRNDIRAFEAAHPDLVSARRGLRVPLVPRAFDALCWAIIGQQINLSFAGSLRRELILLAGERVGDMIVHPTPEAVARIDPDDLTRRRFSRAKARYLIETARTIAEGKLAVEALAEGSAVEAERRLTALHGIGTWTARYVMMRIGFADAAPVGDSGLATALERMYDLAERPDAIATARLMTPYAPWRSLASLHLWASL
ncbi:helix-turn-helix domain-containing protein [Luteibacter sp. CQ10]|uniref:DNA-3-methyladenine glycosylase 2 n=1 Tax=Luteibacter sp. CQ10 TaxID=2805821 RepID=UPI0034A54A16